MKEWSSKTCLRFRPKTEADDDYIEFVYEGGYVLAKISSERQYQKKKSTTYVATGVVNNQLDKTHNCHCNLSAFYPSSS